LERIVRDINSLTFFSHYYPVRGTLLPYLCSVSTVSVWSSGELQGGRESWINRLWGAWGEGEGKQCCGTTDRTGQDPLWGRRTVEQQNKVSVKNFFFIFHL